jgi:hypothetical protein
MEPEPPWAGGVRIAVAQAHDHGIELARVGAADLELDGLARRDRESVGVPGDGRARPLFTAGIASLVAGDSVDGPRRVRRRISRAGDRLPIDHLLGEPHELVISITGPDASVLRVTVRSVAAASRLTTVEADDVLKMPLGPLTGSSGLLRRVGSSARQHKAQ